MKKRIMSLVLAVLMCVSLLPGTAMADEPQTVSRTVYTADVSGDTVDAAAGRRSS